MFQGFITIAGAAIGWLLLRGLIPQLRVFLLDQPNARSSHHQPTPRGGGVVFVSVASATSAIALLCGHGLPASFLPLLAAPLAVVGFIDDRYNLPAWWRFVVQLLTAILMIGFSPLFQQFPFGDAPSSFLFFPVLALLAIAVTAVINFTNFMDGLDGLVAGCMTVIISALAITLPAPLSLWAFLGSLIGFLILNWSPAKVFMGDVGCTFLGAVFAGLVLQAPSWSEGVSYLLVATPLLGDACLCAARRLLAGQRVFQAHRLHLYQRLQQSSWSHSRVTLTYILATLVLAIAMLAGGLPWVFGLAVVEILVGVWLDRCVATPFGMASQN